MIVIGKEEESIVKAIEEYFKKHPDLRWKFGAQVLNGRDTVKLLRNDKKFRKKMVNVVVKYSMEQLLGEGIEDSSEGEE